MFSAINPNRSLYRNKRIIKEFVFLFHPSPPLFRNYCCPVKTSGYGFREAGLPCETHCKLRSGAAVGGKDTRDGSPNGDLYYWRSAGCVSLASRNTILSCNYTHSHATIPTAAPQSGLQWVSHRGVPSAHPVRIKSIMMFFE